MKRSVSSTPITNGLIWESGASWDCWGSRDALRGNGGTRIAGKRNANVGIRILGNVTGGRRTRGILSVGKRTARKFFPNDEAIFLILTSNHGKKSFADCLIRLGLPGLFVFCFTAVFSWNQLTDPLYVS